MSTLTHLHIAIGGSMIPTLLTTSYTSDDLAWFRRPVGGAS